MNSNKIIVLNDYFNDTEIKEMNDRLDGFKGNGKAILIGDVKAFDIFKDLMNSGNKSIAEFVGKLKINRNPDNKSVGNQIDDNSRDFIYTF